MKKFGEIRTVPHFQSTRFCPYNNLLKLCTPLNLDLELDDIMYVWPCDRMHNYNVISMPLGASPGCLAVW